MSRWTRSNVDASTWSYITWCGASHSWSCSDVNQERDNHSGKLVKGELNKSVIDSHSISNNSFPFLFLGLKAQVWSWYRLLWVLSCGTKQEGWKRLWTDSWPCLTLKNFLLSFQWTSSKALLYLLQCQRYILKSSLRLRTDSIHYKMIRHLSF